MSARLLAMWKLARHSPTAWRAVSGDVDDELTRLRTVATAIALPHTAE